MAERFKGIVPPMVTPFNADGTVDIAAFREEVQFLVETGVHGLAVGGSTGEGQTLADEEAWALAEIAVREADERVPVIGGIIVDSTQQAKVRGRTLLERDVSGLQITPVHYLFASSDQEMYDYYAEIAAELTLPILIYNVVPWCYASPELLTRIVTEVEGVVGVKQSAGDLHALAELVVLLEGRGTVMAAVDDLLYPCFCLGAQGAIAAILTAVPELCLQLWSATQEGWYVEARELHERLLGVWMALRGPNLPARVKAAMRMQGRAGGVPRAPMRPCDSEEEKEIRAALQRAGVI
jgi:4-hydroxy-tetrahydrodipicolinate synthase